MRNRNIAVTNVKYVFLFLLLFLLPLGCVNSKTLKRQQQFLKAAEKGNLQQIQHFLNEGVYVDIELRNRTALSFAAQHGHVVIMNYLIKNGAQVNFYGGNWPPLSWALAGKNMSAVQLLLEQGASPDNAGDEKTHLPGYIYAGELEVVEILLRYGANPFLKDHKGRTANNMMDKVKYAKFKPLIEKAIVRRRWEQHLPLKDPEPFLNEELGVN